MDASIRRGSFEMTAAMLVSGTIGWFVLSSGQPLADVVFWRCAIGAMTLLLICGGMGMLRAMQYPPPAWVGLSSVAWPSWAIGCCCSPHTHAHR